MGVVQHKAILQSNRHVPKTHAITSHGVSSVADRGKYVRAHPSTGAIIFAAAGSLPSYAGDPVAPVDGLVWYDTLNDRMRVKLSVGLGTLNVTLD